MRPAVGGAHRGAMNRYLIQRNIPGAGQLSADELQKIARKSVEVLTTLAPRLQWNESFVTADHLYCVYLAEDEEAIREHGRRGGFPVDGIHRVGTVIDPTTAGTTTAGTTTAIER
jgi:hypothetical protein